MSKFKKGDYVLCIKSYRDQFSKSRIYKVTGFYGYGNIHVEKDDVGSFTNGIHKSHFIPLGKKYPTNDVLEIVELLYLKD